MASSANLYPEAEPVAQAGEQRLQLVRGLGNITQHDHGQPEEQPHINEETDRPRIVAEKRHEMLQNFYGYCHDIAGIDPSSTNPADEPALALAVHSFVTSAVHRRAAADQQRNPTGKSSAEPIHVIPVEPIRRRINEYYARFGTDRRNAYEESRHAQETYLSSVRKPVYATLILRDETSETGQKTMPRAAYNQEIGIIMQLREALMEDGKQYAMDGAEIVLAAYGARFLDLAKYADIVVEQSNGQQRLIKRDWDFDEIPEHMRAEEYRPRRHRE